jgi:hypothetical protein
MQEKLDEAYSRASFARTTAGVAWAVFGVGFLFLTVVLWPAALVTSIVAFVGAAKAWLELRGVMSGDPILKEAKRLSVQAAFLALALLVIDYGLILVSLKAVFRF